MFETRAKVLNRLAHFCDMFAEAEDGADSPEFREQCRLEAIELRKRRDNLRLSTGRSADNVS